MYMYERNNRRNFLKNLLNLFTLLGKTKEEAKSTQYNDQKEQCTAMFGGRVPAYRDPSERVTEEMTRLQARCFFSGTYLEHTAAVACMQRQY